MQRLGCLCNRGKQAPVSPESRIGHGFDPCPAQPKRSLGSPECDKAMIYLPAGQVFVWPKCAIAPLYQLKVRGLEHCNPAVIPQTDDVF